MKETPHESAVSDHATAVASTSKAQGRSPSHDDVIDWNVDKLDEETDETHHQEADGCGLGHLHKLCMEKKQQSGAFRDDQSSQCWFRVKVTLRKGAQVAFRDGKSALLLVSSFRLM